FYSAVSALSLGGLVMMLGLILGAILGLRYLYWELEHLPQGTAGGSAETESGMNWKKYSPWLGALVLLAAFFVSGIYRSMALTRTGGLLLCGLAFGIIIQRTRFCFVRAFRDPFMTGESEVGRAVSVSVIISVLGFAALKWTGLRSEEVFVSSTFWLGSLLGGFIFGFGMLLSGGCGSGSLWRAGEGQLKLILAVIFFAFSNFLFRTLIIQFEGLQSLIGVPVFLPDW
ncbi:MAG: YeeE/YedE thiosulfate transporter family protein, partial [SAR324 cluster bacterium]|nr:YeeE/YedE thiosulfate transporter family protein [SAR324 cluster bacterium]